MKIKTALITILGFILVPVFSVYSQMVPVETDDVVVEAKITVDLYSTITLNPVTVQINQPSNVQIRILSPNG
ncbi:MAG: hypothetical protein RBS01_01635, partial [Candidatus Dojkabacteria bacterium]|nr:hypothetical protein [Candidatus Dojkabacteria bacterium]